jgi:CDP-glycerol glycerophosphotransferase
MPTPRQTSITRFRRFLSRGLHEKLKHSNNALVLRGRKLLGQEFAGHGLLSVIVPIYNVERYLRECLESIRAQNYPNIEVLMVDDGSHDGSADIAREFAKKDKRFRLIQKQNAGLGAARNTGIAQAAGEFITFVDSDDAVSYFSYRMLVSTLVSSGSDFAVGSIERWRGNRRWKHHWVARVHAKDQLAISLDDLPEITFDVFAWNKVFRTEFFRRIVGSFPEGILYEDQQPTAKAYTGAKAFDVLEGVTYYWREREDRTSITQNKLSEKDLFDRINVARSVERIYRASASIAVYNFWLQKTAGFDFGHYYRLSIRGSSDYWDALVEFTKALRSSIARELWGGIVAKERVLAFLISENRKAETALVIAAQANYSIGLPTKTERSGLSIDTTRWGIEATGFPAEIIQLGETDTSLKTAITRLEWLGPGILLIQGYAYINNFPRDVTPERARLEISCEDGFSTSANLRTFAFHEDSTDLPRSSFIDYTHSGIEAVVDLTELLADHDHAVLSLSLTVEGITRTGSWRPLSEVKTPVLAPSVLSQAEAYSVRSNMLDGITVLKRSVPLLVTRLAISQEQRRVELQIELADKTRVHRLQLTNRAAAVEKGFRPEQGSANGTHRFSVQLPDIRKTWAEKAETTWEVAAVTDNGVIRLPYPAIERSVLEQLETGALAVSFSLTGDLELSDQPWRLTVYQVEGFERSVRVHGRLSVSPGWGMPQAVLATIENQIIRGSQVSYSSASDEFTADFILTRTPDWGEPYVSPTKGTFGLNLLPAKAHHLDTSSVQVFFPKQNRSGRAELIETANGFALVTDTGFRRGVLIKFDRPIRARDWLASRRLGLLSNVRGQAENQPLLERTVVCMSYSGTSVHDNPAPIAQEMVAQKLVDDVVWIADDRELALQASGRCVVPHSREAIELIHRAKFLINNAHFPHYFRKREGQIYIQTWHGTPLKRIANDVPQTSLSDSYRNLMEREIHYWDLLLAQSPEAGELLKGAFGYTGELLSCGYPRNDVLFDDRKMTDMRQRFRASVGIAKHEPVVLYAPTWRDNALSGLGANGFEQLDVERALSAIGKDAKLLLRGHSNTEAFVRNVASKCLLDVSGISDLAMLFAASDLLITDYSSIFFDYQLTGKPIIGFATDIETYSTTLRGLYFDYRELFPGQIATSNEELVGILRRSQAHSRRNTIAANLTKAERGTAASQVAKRIEQRLHSTGAGGNGSDQMGS